MNKPNKYNLVAENVHIPIAEDTLFDLENGSTVVSEYQSTYTTQTHYESEAELEQAFINILVKNGYEYINIKDEQDLIKHLRFQLEKLNNFTFTDSEWDRFFKSEIAGTHKTIIDKTTNIQEDYIKLLKRDDGTTKTFILSIKGMF